jgi:Uma2 family endonuclease
MVLEKENTEDLPQTLTQFIDWEPNDGHKYEWNDGELIKFTGMKKREYYIFDILNLLFIEKGYYKLGSLISEPDVMLTAIQLRRPDIAFFTREQIYAGQKGEDVVPQFVVELIFPSDDIERVEEKLVEYFKTGVKIVWHVMPRNRRVYVYTTSKTVTICTDDDICTASPVLPDFEISVNQLLG